MNTVRQIFKHSIFKQFMPFFRLSSSESSSGTQGPKGLVVGVYDGDKKKNKEEACIELSPGAYKVDQDVGGKITNALNGLRGDIGTLGKVTVLLNISEEYPAIAVTGMGQKNVNFNDVEYLDEEAENIRIATGAGARKLQKIGVKEVVVEDFNRPEAAAEGAALGVWYYSEKPTETKLSQFTENGDKASGDDWLRGITKAESQNLVRCLCETPPNYITPTHFAQKARDLLCPYGVQVYARDVRWMKEHHLTALLTIASSSIEPPVFLDLNYCSDDPAVKPYAIVGQGSTFNSGGLCLKECRNMMEADFAGAAIILGVFKAVAAMRLPINLRGFVPLYEHMLSGFALKTMDVLKTQGKLIQTPHTDDFHQVAIAEALLLAVNQHCPSNLFVLANLSPVSKASLGGISTVFARCDNTWQHINYAGAVTGDRMWRMPLFKDFAERVTDTAAVDIMNIGKGERGEPCLIGAVLDKIAPPCVDFSYIDITGSSAIANGYVPYLTEGLFTGAPTRAMIQLLCHLDYCKKQTAASESKEKKSASA